MHIKEALHKIEKIQYHSSAPEVAKTASEELASKTQAKIVKIDDSSIKEQAAVFNISLAGDLVFDDFNFKQARKRIQSDFIFCQLKENGSASAVTRRALANLAFTHTADYDAAISDYLNQ